MNDDGMFRQYAKRASQDPAFLGWQLNQFARVQNLDDAGLAAHLGCTVAQLDQLRTCGAVRSEHRRADVNEIATKFHLNAANLAEATKFSGNEPPVEAKPEEHPDVEPAVALLAARDRSETQ